MKKIKTLAVSLLLVGSVIIAIVVNYNIGDTNSKHPSKYARLSQSDLADKVRDLESEIADAEHANDISRRRIDDLESKNSDLESKIDELQDKIEGPVGSSGLKSKVDELEINIDKLERQISVLDFRLSHR